MNVEGGVWSITWVGLGNTHQGCPCADIVDFDTQQHVNHTERKFLGKVDTQKSKQYDVLDAKAQQHGFQHAFRNKQGRTACMSICHHSQDNMTSQSADATSKR